MSKIDKVISIYHLMSLLLKLIEEKEIFINYNKRYYFGENNDMYIRIYDFDSLNRGHDLYVALQDDNISNAISEFNICNTWFIYADFKSLNSNMMLERTELEQIIKDYKEMDPVQFTLTHGREFCAHVSDEYLDEYLIFLQSLF